MKPCEQDKLLEELLAGPELATLRRASLDNGLALLQRHRRAWQIRTGLLACIPLVLLLVLLLHQPASQKGLFGSGSTSLIAQPKSSSVKVITDAELLALFPGRPVALIGRPGQQQLVFLDQPTRFR